MLTAIIADDLTGAADTGLQFARSGYRTAVVFGGAEMELRDLDAVAFDTDSRLAPPGPAAERVAEAVLAVRNARILYKKMDSTLRGNLAAELYAALEASGRERAVVAPAFPDAGRTTEGGVQFVNGVPVHETGMRDDPKTPVLEGHLPTLLSGEFAVVGTLDVEDLGDPATVRWALEKSRCVVADARSNADLEALVRAVPDPSEVLWAGSAGLAMALAGVYPGPHAGETSAALVAHRVLVVIGSLSGASREQLLRLVEKHGAVATPVAGRTGVEGAFEAARAALAGGGCAILHSPEKRMYSRGRPPVTLLADVAGRLAREGLFDALVATGGSTAVAVARRLGASGIRLEGEVEAGVPVGTLVGPRPYRIVTKAGGFGNPDTLARAVETLTGKE